MLRHPHVQASQEDLAMRLQQEMKARTSSSSPRQKLFHKTLAFFVALSKQGCGAPPFEETIYEGEEAERRAERIGQLEKVRRGHEPKTTCPGRLIFEYDRNGAAFLRFVCSVESFLFYLFMLGPIDVNTTAAVAIEIIS